MDAFVQSIADSIAGALGAPLAVFLLSMIPIAEARFAIPFGMSMGLKPWEALGWAFLGSAMITPILLLILIPIINALAKTKVFSKLGKFLYDKFDKKSKRLKSDGAESIENNETHAKKAHITKKDLKRMGGAAAFVAIPLPLTGVWTGSAVSSIIKLGFVKGLISIILGNAVACSIITLISFLFQPYVNYITLAFFIIAVIVVIILIVKLIIYKPDKNAAIASVDTTEVNADATVESDTDDANKQD